MLDCLSGCLPRWGWWIGRRNGSHVVPALRPTWLLGGYGSRSAETRAADLLSQVRRGSMMWNRYRRCLQASILPYAFRPTGPAFSRWVSVPGNGLIQTGIRVAVPPPCKQRLGTAERRSTPTPMRHAASSPVRVHPGTSPATYMYLPTYHRMPRSVPGVQGYTQAAWRSCAGTATSSSAGETRNLHRPSAAQYAGGAALGPHTAPAHTLGSRRPKQGWSAWSCRRAGARPLSRRRYRLRGTIFLMPTLEDAAVPRHRLAATFPGMRQVAGIAESIYSYQQI